MAIKWDQQNQISVPQTTAPTKTTPLDGFMTIANQSQYFKPNLSSNPVIAGVQNFGTGVAKGAAETVRGFGQLGAGIQRGVNKLAGTSLPVTTAYDDGGAFDNATTPQGTMQKVGYGTEKVAELVTPLGKEKGASSVAGLGVKGTAGTVKTASSIATGIPREVLTRASSAEYAPKIERAIADIAETPNQPYLKLAQRTGERIVKAEKDASAQLNQAVNEFKQFQGSRKFDVSSKIAPIASALKPFSTSGLKVVQTREGGKFGRYVIEKSQQSPFTDKEVSALQDIMDTIRNSKAVEVDDVLALRKKLSAAYDAIPLGVNGNPRPYHAALMSLKAETEKAIDELLPKGLRQANAQYRKVYEMKDAFGNRIVDGQGNLKDNAEQFLSNIGNMNKGQLRSEIEKYKELTGIDLTDEIQTLKDAQKLSPIFASTGSRTQDILRALVVGSVGAGTGGTLGTGLGLAATSPRVIGKVATTVGKAKGSIRRLLQSSGEKK
jgi:hypothetical protein